jgi:predicted nucleotidyltransferase
VIDESAITRAGELLAAAAPAGSTIILFGSRARGGADEHSDLDFVVIEPEVTARAAEMVRLRDALDPLEIAADVVVVSREHAEGWGRVPGTVLFDALNEGRVLART